MAGEPWSIGELETLLTNGRLPDDALAALLPGRSAGAVAAMREAAHCSHTGAPESFNLKSSFRQWIAERPGVFRCPACNALL